MSGTEAALAIKARYLKHGPVDRNFKANGIHSPRWLLSHGVSWTRLRRAFMHASPATPAGILTGGTVARHSEMSG
jgi:hypothetical protein